VSGQRAVLEVNLQYRGIGGAGINVARFGSWQAEFVDSFVIPVQYQFAVRGGGSADLVAGDFTKIASK
jgi:hypothetical protein